VAYHRLRDFIQSEKLRQRREQQYAELKELVKQMALAFPTYGHRPLQREMLAHGIGIGREKLRRILAELGLSQKPVKKPRRAAPEVTAFVDYPPGRRLQIDATQVRLGAGKVWLYLVEDVPSRALLAIRAVHSLAKESAQEVLAEAVGVLGKLAIFEPLVIQSDGGSDFTSELFQDYCRLLGCWIRSKVNQKGGMGILERLNRTLKYEWLFRHEYRTLFELQALAEGFKDWYNHQRRHSSLAYQTPSSRLPKPQEQALDDASQVTHPLAPASSGAHGLPPDDVSLPAVLAGSFLAQIEAPKTPGRFTAVQDGENHNLSVSAKAPTPSRVAPSTAG
jgi:transposase InsO family protein